jgi:hypothetical protein
MSASSFINTLRAFEMHYICCLHTYTYPYVCLYTYDSSKNPIQFLTCKFKTFYEATSNTNVHSIHKDLKQ